MPSPTLGFGSVRNHYPTLASVLVTEQSQQSLELVISFVNPFFFFPPYLLFARLAGPHRILMAIH